MKTVKAAAVQLSPVLYSREGTVEKVVRTIHELHQKGVQFATFPETVVPYYPYFSFVQSPYQMVVGPEHLKLLNQAVTVPSPATSAISDACKQAGVVASIGVNERDGGTLYNTQLLFDADGTLIQRRRKISPTYHERMARRICAPRLPEHRAYPRCDQATSYGSSLSGWGLSARRCGLRCVRCPRAGRARTGSPAHDSLR